MISHSTPPGILLAAVVGLLLGVGSARAADVATKERLIQTLECRAEQDCAAPPPRRTRGLQPTAKRSFQFEPTEAGRKDVDQRVQTGKLPSADLEVYFEYNSAIVGPAAQQTLATLASALVDPRLATNSFILVGHTDAKGGPTYNQALSERRAAAVKQHLVTVHRIAPDRLLAYGRGLTALKNAADPFAAENRRVQVINQGTVIGETR